MLAVLGYSGCQEPEAIGGPEDAFVWADTSEHEIRVVEIQGDSVRIVELRSFRDTNRVYTEKRYTTDELNSWHRDNMARLARIEPDIIKALNALIADSLRKE